MKLTVYKGFDKVFLQKLNNNQLVNTGIDEKKSVLNFNKETKKQLERAFLSLNENDEVWVTYEEYTLIKNRVRDAVEEDGLKLVIFRNNLYPDYYPVEFEFPIDLSSEIIAVINGDKSEEPSELCQKYLNIYNALVEVEGSYYGSYYNYEYELNTNTLEYYHYDDPVEEGIDQCDYSIFINDDIDTYLRNLHQIKLCSPKVIGFQSTEGEISKRIQKSLQAYCIENKIRIIKIHEQLPKNEAFENELISIAQNDIHIKGFVGFRNIKFYKNPDVDKEVIELSQGQIIQEIIHQAENSYNLNGDYKYRDIFITASTGAGKSVMFQIPAVYLAQKYNKLTIIIEPVKALMYDQKEKLNHNGYMRVETFNSDLITQVEKEAVLQRIRNGEVDLLYLSPETLLSYSIETIIGDREIGLLIVDEAHIVTTWGVGFRPDYWYLGGYINRLRNQIQTSKGMKRKIYHFPICAFTATAINGGVDDSVGDTIISLYMENPIKYIGYVKRDNIVFEIVHKGNSSKLPKTEYEQSKTRDLNVRIQQWLNNNEKTIVYFPYASLVGDASKGLKNFAGITIDKRIGTYTGRNINELSSEAFNEAKRNTFDSFRNGSVPIILATKAFGMGVDIDDVQNVYHYAVTGNLSDYVQEIGRVARKESITGLAVTDNYYNDMSFMKTLFGMSQIRQYQIKCVLEVIYNTYKSKNESRNFLISPESFTYIFNDSDEGKRINKLKTCLMMLEKDFYEKFNFKVIVSRPQSVFTKAFICIDNTHKEEVLASEYGKYMTFEEKGRYNEIQLNGDILNDFGDIYKIDLEKIWEKFYPNISFPQFKYWYFNPTSQAKSNGNIMSSIREYIRPRQKISIEVRGEGRLLSDVRELILNDFDYIVDKLYKEYGNKQFTSEDFVRLICEKYGKFQAQIIVNSLFDLADPKGKCVKKKSYDTIGNTYSLAHGNFKYILREFIIKSRIISNITRIKDTASYTGFMAITNELENTALKLLSIFNYISYEVAGGEEPEIFIRLNDPNKIRSIVQGNTFYSNNYVSRAKKKHDRDVAILRKFFNDLLTNEERWNFIEDYFLGYDVLEGTITPTVNTVKMSRSIDKEHSYPTNMFNNWGELVSFLDEEYYSEIDKLSAMGIPIPEYLETVIKKSDEGDDIIMCWSSKDTLICHQDTSDQTLSYFESKGWHAYRINEIDYEKVKEVLS